MFLDFYKLRDQPFGVTPDARFLYMGPGYRETLASLIYSVRMGRGFDALIAPPGMGKTTLLFHLLEHLRPTSRSAFLFKTQCDEREFLRYLMADIGVDSPPGDYVRMNSALNEFLVHNAEEGKQFVLVIDEAQNLSEEVLEAVRLLSDFETSRRKLMHIILAGQQQLARKLTRPSLLQLRQRISSISQIRPLDSREVRHYIEHRLRIAGYAGRSFFTAEAINLIATHSEGIPRNINNICFGALSLGFANGNNTIDANIVEEVVASRVLEDVRPSRPATPPAIYKLSPAEERSASIVHALPASKTQDKRGQRLISFLTRAVGYAFAVSLLAVAPVVWHESQSAQRRPLLEPRPGALPEPVAQPSVISKERVEEANVATGEIVVVRPNDTLWQITESHLGTVNGQILKEIMRLNGDLANPEHVEEGQRIRLPALSTVIKNQGSADEITKFLANDKRGTP